MIPSNHKWFRNLAVSRIVVDSMKDLGMRLRKPTVDLEAIRKEYHEAAEESGESTTKGNGTQMALPLRLKEVSVLQSGMRSRLRRWAQLRSTAGLVAIPFPCHAR